MQAEAVGAGSVRTVLHTEANNKTVNGQRAENKPWFLWEAFTILILYQDFSVSQKESPFKSL